MESVEVLYRAFPPDFASPVWWRGGRSLLRGAAALEKREVNGALGMPMAAGAPMVSEVTTLATLALSEAGEGRARSKGIGLQGGSPPADKAPITTGVDQRPMPVPDLSKVPARKNLNETALLF